MLCQFQISRHISNSEFFNILAKLELNLLNKGENSKPIMNSVLVIFSVIFILMLITSIHSNATVHALQVDRYWSVLEPSKSTITFANGFIGMKFREDFKQMVFNVNVNNIDNITGIYLYNHGDNTQNRNATMILDLLNESKEVKVKDKFKEASKTLSKKHEIEGTVAVGGVTSDDLEGILKGKSLKSLHKLVQNEDVNVIVATKEFPRGEIYGHEFVPIDRFFPDISDFKWN
jgi:hypothetical protein